MHEHVLSPIESTELSELKAATAEQLTVVLREYETVNKDEITFEQRGMLEEKIESLKSLMAAANISL